MKVTMENSDFVGQSQFPSTSPTQLDSSKRQNKHLHPSQSQTHFKSITMFIFSGYHPMLDIFGNERGPLSQSRKAVVSLTTYSCQLPTQEHQSKN
ncbi:hypothetical protein TNCV_3380591 [Trichonephila clavipes]|nr:hypothetical protein TNCV_3380591 [Trichonephila clavipes]